MKNYLTEFIGTFFLVLTIGLVSASGSVLTPLAIGSVLMVMVYLGGHVSGAHYNPAVSIAVCLRGKLPGNQLVPYMVAQILGASVAGAAVYFLNGTTFAPAPSLGVSSIQALGAELLFTFALVLVVLNVATAKATEGNSYYGLAIGFTVFVGAISVGPISGGAFNPAVGLGPTIVNTVFGEGDFRHVWLYLVGPLVGGILAVGAFKIQHDGQSD